MFPPVYILKEALVIGAVNHPSVLARRAMARLVSKEFRVWVWDEVLKAGWVHFDDNTHHRIKEGCMI
jgi:hypothetical protein